MGIVDQPENNTESVIPNVKNTKQTFVGYGELFDYSLSFSGLNENYCLGVVDMVDSTRISAAMNRMTLSKYYSIFLNSMASVVKKYRGTVIKNLGDSLLYFFPESEESKDDFAFMSSLECGLAMSEERIIINSNLSKENLPPLSYRISADYGNVLLARSHLSPCIDIFGPTVNMCSKINKVANKNSFIIGGDLYQIVRRFSNYFFKGMGSYDVGLREKYPIYTVTRA